MWRRGRDRRSRGVTLLELLVVLAVLSILMGMGLGVVQRLRPGGRETRRAIAGLLRAGRLLAVETGRPQVLRIDDGGGRIRLADWVPLLEERFDEDTGLPGAIPGTLGSARVVGPEQQLAIEMPAARTGRRVGLRVEMDVRHESGSGPLLRLGEALLLEVLPDGSLRAEARDEGTLLLELETGPARLPEGRFVELALSWLPGSLVLERAGAIERVARDEDLAPALLAPSVAIGSEDRDLDVVVDELRVWSLDGGEEVRLPSGASIVRSPTLLEIDPLGRLDRRRHEAPEEIVVEERGGDAETYVVGLDANLVDVDTSGGFATGATETSR